MGSVPPSWTFKGSVLTSAVIQTRHDVYIPFSRGQYVYINKEADMTDPTVKTGSPYQTFPRRRPRSDLAGCGAIILGAVASLPVWAAVWIVFS